MSWARADSRLRMGDRELGSELMLRTNTSAGGRVHLFEQINYTVDYTKQSICGRIASGDTLLFGRYLLADAYAIDPNQFCLLCLTVLGARP